MQNKPKFPHDNEEIEIVHEYTYLGVVYFPNAPHLLSVDFDEEVLTVCTGNLEIDNI